MKIIILILISIFLIAAVPPGTYIEHEDNSQDLEREEFLRSWYLEPSEISRERADRWARSYQRVLEIAARRAHSELSRVREVMNTANYTINEDGVIVMGTGDRDYREMILFRDGSRYYKDLAAYRFVVYGIECVVFLRNGDVLTDDGFYIHRAESGDILVLTPENVVLVYDSNL